MKIGITEQGDASLDFSWKNKLSQLDGCILITKTISDVFIKEILDAYANFKNIILHCTCTSYGGSILEPNVPIYQRQLMQLKQLIIAGFPAENVVLRIDPIIPDNLDSVKDMLDYAQRLDILRNINRIKISVIDDYRHVKQRFIDAKLNTVYPEKFYASFQQMNNVNMFFKTLKTKFPHLEISCCAEPYLDKNIFKHTGCVSEDDLRIFNLTNTSTSVNPQNRKGCLCLDSKTELLNNKHRCAHKCLYCYWRD